MDDLLEEVLGEAPRRPGNRDAAAETRDALQAACSDAEFLNHAVSDIIAAIKVLLGEIPEVLRKPGIPRLVSANQIWSIVSRSTAMTREFDSLKRSGDILTFDMPSGRGDQAVLTRDEYVAAVQSTKQRISSEVPEAERATVLRTLAAFREEVLASGGAAVSTEALSRALREEEGAGEERPAKRPKPGGEGRALERAVSVLTSGGLAISTGGILPQALIPTVPGMGAFADALREGRRALESLLRRRPHPEVAEAELMRKKPPSKCKAGWRFALRDMEGSGRVQRLHTPGAEVLRLANDDKRP